MPSDYEPPATSGVQPLAITGVGLVSSAGADALAVFGAVNTDEAQLQESRYSDAGFEPIIGAPVPPSEDPAIRHRRLWSLAQSAAAAALTMADGAGEPLSRSGLGVCWAAPPADRPGYAARTVKELAKEFLTSLQIENCAFWQEQTAGHAASLWGLLDAREKLGERTPACLVGGADSLLQLQVLRWLEADDRLKSTFNIDGLIPGEAAAFVVVETVQSVKRRNGLVLAWISGLAKGQERASVLSDLPCKGEALTHVFRNALAEAEIGPHELAGVMCDLNGESYRANEWGLASVRVGFGSEVGMKHPADVLGDVGAATGAVLLSLAALSAADSASPLERTLVYAGGETGQRGAAILSPSTRAALPKGSPPAAAPPSPLATIAANPPPGRETNNAMLEEHLDEIDFLWQQRANILQSNEFHLIHLRRLEQRLEERVRAVRLEGAGLLPVAESRLAEQDEGVVFSSAYALLRCQGDRGIRLVVDRLLAGAAAQRRACAAALCQGSLGKSEGDLQKAVQSGELPAAAASAEVLAFHGLLPANSPRLAEMLASDNSEVRLAGWRTAALLDSAKEG